MRGLSRERSGQRQAAHEDQNEEIPKQQELVATLQEMKQIAMNDPDLTENDETANEDDQLRPQSKHDSGILRSRNRLRYRWKLDIENEKRHRDGEDSIAESLYARRSSWLNGA